MEALDPDGVCYEEWTLAGRATQTFGAYRHTVLVMAALAICAVTAALLRDRTDTRPRRRSGPMSGAPADPGMIPLTVPEIARLLATPPTTPGHTEYWSNWRRRQQARARWYHQRTRLDRNPTITLVS